MNRRGFIACITLLVALTACTRSEDKPRGDGSVRLVVLSPAMAVTLRDLGKDQLIVGRHAFDVILLKDLPVAGDQHSINYELLVTLHPTHVLLETGATDVPPRLNELAASNSWQIVTLPMLTLDDVRTAIERLDAITGGPSKVGKDQRDRLDTAISSRPGLGDRLGRVLALAWTDPPGILGPGSFHAQMLAAMGATPIPEKGSAYIEWSVEDVVRANPDSLLLFLPGTPEEDLAKTLGPLARANLRCVREGRVMVIRDPLCHTPSTALANLADAIVASSSGWPPIEARP